MLPTLSQFSQTGGAKAALAAAFLATAVSFGVPDPMLLSARADEEAGATAFEKRQAAVERRKEIMAKACALCRDQSPALVQPARAASGSVRVSPAHAARCACTHTQERRRRARAFVSCRARSALGAAQRSVRVRGGMAPHSGTQYQ